MDKKEKHFFQIRHVFVTFVSKYFKDLTQHKNEVEEC
jgi:hypothetical protein